jgi:hypothetical protein
MPPLLVRTRHGARFAEGGRFSPMSSPQGREAHWAQTLAVVGELGLGREHRLTIPNAEFTIRDVVTDLIAAYSASGENEWALAALAMYFAPRQSWQNASGEEFSFSTEVNKLADTPVGFGSCGGTHVLYTLAIIRQVDQKHGILSSELSFRVDQYLRRAAGELSSTQDADGSWSTNWAASINYGPRFGSLNSRIWMTGHHLDWMAIVPAELRVDDDRIRSAGQFVARVIRESEPANINGNVCHYIHGVRGVARIHGL